MTGAQAKAEPAALARIFTALRAESERVCARREVTTHRLSIGSQSIELRLAGPAVTEAVRPALAHLTAATASTAPPDLTISVWDTSDADAHLPDLPQMLNGTIGRWHYDGTVCLSVQLFESAISGLDFDRGEAVHCVADARDVAPYDVAHPLGELLAWWMSRSGHYRVHAAAVGTAAGGVLLTGASGAGKSTSALAGVGGGMRFAGDDMVLVRGDPPTAVSLYNTARADRDLLERYPDALPRLELPSGEGKLVRFFPAEEMTQAMPLRAVVLPRVAPGSRCRIEPEAPAFALRTLAPWAVLHSPGAGPQALRAIRELLTAVPVYRLRVGDDLARIPALLSELIERSHPCS